MKQQIISEVVQQMLPHLDNAQMQQLQKVLESTLFGCEITAQTEKKDTDNNPNGICKDITGLGRWGNGDVELFMEHQDELDQIL